MPNLIPFQFHSTTVSTITDDEGTPWFIAADVCAALEEYEGIHKEIYQEHFSLLDVLAIASDIQDKQLAFDFLAWVSQCASILNVATKSFWQLYGCAAQHIIWEGNHRNRDEDEFYWHKIFLEHLEYLIPGAQLVPGKRIEGGGIPDFLIKIENDVCPVEIKRKFFKDSAVRQLRQYIVDSQAAYGFAVAQKCTAKLDANMVFVSLEGLE